MYEYSSMKLNKKLFSGFQNLNPFSCNVKELYKILAETWNKWKDRIVVRERP